MPKENKVRPSAKIEEKWLILHLSIKGGYLLQIDNRRFSERAINKSQQKKHHTGRKVHPMYKHIKAIPLRSVRYSDKNSILTVLTSDSGEMALLMPESAGRESRRRRALTMPMSIIECEVDIRPGRDIHTVREMRALAVYPEITAEPAKAAIAMFMAEVIQVVFRESGTTEATVWDTLTGAVATLSALRRPRALAVFPLWFMGRMAFLAGIEPDTGPAEPGSVLDMTEGIFRHSAPISGEWLPPEPSRVARLLATLPPHHLSLLPIDGAGRREAMTRILRYFALHNIALTGLKSLPILHALVQ